MQKFYHRFFFLLCCVILSASQLSFAQFDNSALENRIRPDSSRIGELHLNLYNFNYVRNYEYFNGFQDGYTLYGIQLMPQFTYYAHPNLNINIGAYLRKDFGNAGFQQIQPLISLKYHKKDLTLNFGVLEGNIEHRYIEPLYDFERKITTPIQYGTQLIVEKKSYSLDAWISWERMIYKPSPVKEQIAGGLSAEVTLSDRNSVKFSVPVQFLAFHEGGQIDIKNGIPLSTLFNGAVGIKIQKSFLSGQKVKNIFTENYVVGYKDFSSNHQRPYLSGNGLWLNAGITTMFGTFVTSYWKGNGFITIKGMPLFQSVSTQINHPGYTESTRELLMLRYAYQKKLLPNLYLDIRLEPVIDLRSSLSKQIDFSNSFFLTYKEDFNFGKIKK